MREAPAKLKLEVAGLAIVALKRTSKEVITDTSAPLAILSFVNNFAFALGGDLSGWWVIPLGYLPQRRGFANDCYWGDY